MSYKTYFFTYNPLPIQEQIKTAVADHYRRESTLPAGIIVNKKSVDSAAQAARDLKLDLPVTCLGGCLLNEVWLTEKPARV